MNEKLKKRGRQERKRKRGGERKRGEKGGKWRDRGHSHIWKEFPKGYLLIPI